MEVRRWLIDTLYCRWSGGCVSAWTTHWISSVKWGEREIARECSSRIIFKDFCTLRLNHSCSSPAPPLCSAPRRPSPALQSQHVLPRPLHWPAGRGFGWADEWINPSEGPSLPRYVEALCSQRDNDGGSDNDAKSELCQSYVRAKTELRQSYVRAMSELCQSYVRAMSELRQSYVRAMSELNHAMLELCQS